MLHMRNNWPTAAFSWDGLQPDPYHIDGSRFDRARCRFGLSHSLGALCRRVAPGAAADGPGVVAGAVSADAVAGGVAGAGGGSAAAGSGGTRRGALVDRVEDGLRAAGRLAAVPADARDPRDDRAQRRHQRGG